MQVEEWHWKLSLPPGVVNEGTSVVVHQTVQFKTNADLTNSCHDKDITHMKDKCRCHWRSAALERRASIFSASPEDLSLNSVAVGCLTKLTNPAHIISITTLTFHTGEHSAGARYCYDCAAITFTLNTSNIFKIDSDSQHMLCQGAQRCWNTHFSSVSRSFFRNCIFYLTAKSSPSKAVLKAAGVLIAAGAKLAGLAFIAEAERVSKASAFSASTSVMISSIPNSFKKYCR